MTAAVKADFGSVQRLITTSKNRREAHDRLVACNGIGDVTARIFLDEVPAKLYATA